MEYNPLFFRKLRKILQNLSSAAVVICTLRVNIRDTKIWRIQKTDKLAQFHYGGFSIKYHLKLFSSLNEATINGKNGSMFFPFIVSSFKMCFPLP